MKNVFGLLAAAIAVIFLTCPASAGFRSFSAPHFSAPRYSAPRFSAPRSRSFSRGRTNYRSRSFSRSRTRSHSVTHSRSFTRHSSTRHQHASPHRPSHATHTVKQQHLTTHGDKHGGSQKRVQRFNPTASVGHYAPGTLLHNSYNGHNLTHKVVGSRHKELVDHKFRKPPAHLHQRLAALHAHRWHRHWKRVVIIGAGGYLACDLYCEFDVPTDVYGDFVAAVDEAEADEAEAAAYAPDTARKGPHRGWDKAVDVLEAAASKDDKEAADAKATGGDAETVIDQPDELVDVVVAEDDNKK